MTEKNWITALNIQVGNAICQDISYNSAFFPVKHKYCLATKPSEAFWGKNKDTFLKLFPLIFGLVFQVVELLASALMDLVQGVYYENSTSAKVRI